MIPLENTSMDKFLNHLLFFTVIFLFVTSCASMKKIAFIYY